MSIKSVAVLKPPGQKVLNDFLTDFPETGAKYKDFVFHKGSHPNYTILINTEIDLIMRSFNRGKGISKAKALEQMHGLAEKAKKALMSVKNEVDNILKVDDIIEF